MNAEQKLKKAKLQIALSFPFFSSLLFRREIEFAECQTARTDGKVIQVSRDFISLISLLNTIYLLLHEVGHIALFHHIRRGCRDVKTWNEACDYVINLMLNDYANEIKLKTGYAPFVMPQGGLVDERFRGMNAEQVYQIIWQENQQQQKQENQQGEGEGEGNGKQDGNNNNSGEWQGGQMGDVEDGKGDAAKQEAELKQELAQAAQLAKLQGKLPAHIARMVEDELYNVQNWKEILSAFINEQAKNDYSFKRPNIRYSDTGMMLPSLYSQEIGNIALIVDTSGSIDRQLLNQFAGEIKDIAGELQTSINVIYVDAKLQGVQEFEPDDIMNLQPKGGGGTNFKPGFDYIDKEDMQPACIIYFTDGYCSDFPKNEPSQPTLWATYNNKDFNPPFGETIYIQN